MSSARLNANSGAGSWVLTGVLAGLVAGLVFIVFEVIVAGILTPSLFGPPRMMSGILLGQGAVPMQPTISLAVAVPIGLVVHFVLSAIYGAVFGAISSAVGFLSSSSLAIIVAASAFGLILWLVNFFVIAPIAFPWFTMANQVVQFLAHTFFFGTALGLLLAGRLGD